MIFSQAVNELVPGDVPEKEVEPRLRQLTIL